MIIKIIFLFFKKNFILGFIRSQSERFFTITDNGEQKEYRLVTDQQIHYKECSQKVLNVFFKNFFN